MKPDILIIGATGNIGSHLTKQLSETHANRIVVTSRDKDKVNAFKNSGIEAITLDLHHLDGLDKLLAQCQKVFLNSTFSPELIDLHKAFIDLCSKNKVAHIVRISALGAGTDNKTELANLVPSQIHTDVEKHLELSGIAYTHIRPNYFMENLLSYLPMMKNTGTFTGAFGEGKISFISTSDIAAVAKAALLESNYANLALEATGSNAYTMQEAAEKFSNKLHKSIQYNNISLAEVKNQLTNAGFPSLAVEGIAAMQQCFSQNHAASITDVVEKTIKQEPLSLEDWLNTIDLSN